MNFVKKILLAHSDEKTRRTLTLLLAGVGYDVRPCGRAPAALEAARAEWFDLALLANPLSETDPVEFVHALRKLQPRIPVLLLVNQLELPSVIQGIRLAVTDVLAPDGDWTHVVRRIHELLRPGETAGPADLTPEELAEVEAILAKFDASVEDLAPAPAGPPAPADTLRDELQRLTRERDDIKQAAERLAREKAALEAELKAQQAKQGDLARLEAERTALATERELVAAAQAAVDEKARALAAAREELNRERAALAAERAQPAPAQAAPRKDEEELARQRSLLEDLRLDLQAEALRLREEGTALRDGQAALEADRQRVAEDLELLRQQEENLRAYEQRLRQPVAAEPAPAPAPEPQPVFRALPRPSNEPFSRDPYQRDPSAEEAWKKVNRAMDMLEAERRNFTDEKLVLKEERARIQQWEAQLREVAAALEEREQQLNVAPPPRPSLTHAPFRAAKAMLGAVRK